MEDLLKQLKRHHDTACPHEVAVFTDNGKRLTEFKRNWRTVVKKVGLDGPIFHDTRRSGDKMMWGAGMMQDVIM